MKKTIYEDKKHTVEMTNHSEMGLRCGFEEDPNIINMVDPSGGPYITLGDDLGSFFNDKKSRIVKAINIFPGIIEFIIK